jgi:hypothetical protein
MIPWQANVNQNEDTGENEERQERFQKGGKAWPSVNAP